MLHEVGLKFHVWLENSALRLMFDADAEVKSTVKQFFKAIPKEEFKKAIHVKWPDKMCQCIHTNGRHFKKCLEPSYLSDYDGNRSASD